MLFDCRHMYYNVTYQAKIIPIPSNLAISCQLFVFFRFLIRMTIRLPDNELSILERFIPQWKFHRSRSLKNIGVKTRSSMTSRVQSVKYMKRNPAKPKFLGRLLPIIPDLPEENEKNIKKIAFH
jgi:hypothetical protein